MQTKDTNDERFMKEALKQAGKAYALGEVPIGAVVVFENRVIGRGYNRRNTDKVALAHAEITAIKKAAKVMGDWRLEGCTIYVTLEPCPMCAGAIVQSRIDRCVFACASDKAGCAGSLINLLDMKELNHQVEIESGVMEEESRELIQAFFKRLRKQP